ncbi:alpha/beta fold hydrolase [Gordonia sp. SID5947]|uniref:alpha/beta fold hydrolase n=1 Tax=Gordonia sp. SID5947 TaxID=2690315 RepID=UPI0031BA9137
MIDIGPSDGEPVVLLHGFPQDASCWSEIQGGLVAAGHRVLAPTQRGYSPGAQPADRSAYAAETLIRDVVALLDAAELPTAHIVGHDWGGALVWIMRKRYAHRLRSATVVSTPHHAALSWAMTHTTQPLRSWYMAAVALPRVPEVFLRRHLATYISKTGLPEDRANHYQSVMQTGATATGALNWYRQAFAEQIRSTKPANSSIPATAPPPTTYVWGNQDAFFGRAVAERTQHIASEVDFYEISGGHWLPETKPDELTEIIVDRVKTAHTAQR